MKLYNTLSRLTEDFRPLNPPYVTLYCCGPTVYDFSHIGHYRTYVGNDVIRKTLTYLGYKVKHVMNITDVGHLSDDADAGEDKMEKGAKKYKKTVWDVAEFYTDFFFKANDAFNINRPDIVCKATKHIGDIINLIKKIEKKGFTYMTDEALYFDVTKFDGYDRLSGQNTDEKKQAVREEVVVDKNKKHPADFVLWFKRTGRFKNHTMHWDSPWGDGFPGWHIECSAMSMKYLGDQIDIHTGGVDHIPLHHPNEIAQSESATDKHPFVKYWVHHNFLLVDNQKMSKSLNNFFTIEDIKKNRIHPLAIRLLFLQTHYRKEMNFTWESARSAQEAYYRLKEYVSVLKNQSERVNLSQEKMEKIEKFKQDFVAAVSNDFQLPQALAVVWQMIKSNIPSADKLDLLFDFDNILGLGLNELETYTIPQTVNQLAERRLKARLEKDFGKSDELRKKIESFGYTIIDTENGFDLKKRN
jgi:cysteinyl-tRNA synthetase